MTLRHIVSWKLSGQDRAERDEQAAAVIGALAPLADSVPSVRALSVHRNDLYDGDNWDVTLVADFDDEAGLDAYVVHPEHEAAVVVVKARVAGRVATDFYL